MAITYKIETTILLNGTIEQELFKKENNHTARLSKWVINTKEESIKNALIKLGWTPPKKEESKLDEDIE